MSNLGTTGGEDRHHASVDDVKFNTEIQNVASSPQWTCDAVSHEHTPNALMSRKRIHPFIATYY